ncbi:unnamed protein product [Musa hybrid cultivar]
MNRAPPKMRRKSTKARWQTTPLRLSTLSMLMGLLTLGG